MKKFIDWCRRYLSWGGIVVMGFILYVAIFERSSFDNYVANLHTIDSLRAEIKMAEDTISLYTRLNDGLISDPELMERVVREQYNMVREGEDVYVYK